MSIPFHYSALSGYTTILQHAFKIVNNLTFKNPKLVIPILSFIQFLIYLHLYRMNRSTFMFHKNRSISFKILPIYLDYLIFYFPFSAFIITFSFSSTPFFTSSLYSVFISPLLSVVFISLLFSFLLLLFLFDIYFYFVNYFLHSILIYLSLNLYFFYFSFTIIPAFVFYLHFLNISTLHCLFFFWFFFLFSSF